MHPIRMKILLALVDQRRTTQQLAEMLDDIPQATLYRHLNKLVQGDVIEIVEERPVRGTIEKVYTLSRLGMVNLAAADIENASKDELMRFFTSFLMSLLGDFSHYLSSKEKPDLLADGVSFRQVPMYLSNQEYQEFGLELRKILLKVLENKPAPERRHRVFSIVVLPVEDTTR